MNAYIIFFSYLLLSGIPILFGGGVMWCIFYVLLGASFNLAALVEEVKNK